MSEVAHIKLAVKPDIPFVIVPLHARMGFDGTAVYLRGKVWSGEEYIHRGHPGALPKHSVVVEDPRSKKQRDADEAAWAQHLADVKAAKAANKPRPPVPGQTVIPAGKPGPKPKREDVPGQGPDALDGEQPIPVGGPTGL